MIVFLVDAVTGDGMYDGVGIDALVIHPIVDALVHMLYLLVLGFYDFSNSSFTFMILFHYFIALFTYNNRSFRRFSFFTFFLKQREDSLFFIFISGC